MKIVIIGGVAGGATAAARLRRLNEDAQIIMLERGGYVSYANCGLPYYIGGEISDRRKLTLQTPESFRRRFNIDVRINSEAVLIDPARKFVRVRRSDGSEYKESYDKLVYAPGAKAALPPFVGRGDRIFTLRTVEDTFRLDDFIGGKGPKSVLVIGGGFIGLEAAENLIRRGMRVTLVQMEEQVMLPFDYDMACILHAKLREAGVDLRLKSKVTALSQEGNEVTACIEGGECVTADAALVAVGVTPDTRLAKEAGLSLGVRGAVVVDEHMRTSDPDIYAAGDAVLVRNSVTGAEALVPLAGPANKQGRIAADNICGIPSVYRGAQGSSVLKLFDMTAASTGLSERAAHGARLDEGVLFKRLSRLLYISRKPRRLHGHDLVSLEDLCDLPQLVPVAARNDQYHTILLKVKQIPRDQKFPRTIVIAVMRSDLYRFPACQSDAQPLCTPSALFLRGTDLRDGNRPSSPRGCAEHDLLGRKQDLLSQKVRKGEDEGLCKGERHRAENYGARHILFRHGESHGGNDVERGDDGKHDDPEDQKCARIRIRLQRKAVCAPLSRRFALPLEQRMPPDTVGDRPDDERKDGFQNGCENKNQQQLPPHTLPRYRIFPTAFTAKYARPPYRSRTILRAGASRLPRRRSL